jgi:hypothetical protein
MDFAPHLRIKWGFFSTQPLRLLELDEKMVDEKFEVA